MIFIGSIYPKEIMQEVISNSKYVEFASNNYQYALLSGFDFYDKDLQVITYPILKVPFTKKVGFKALRFIREKSNKNLFVGSIHVPIFQKIHECYNVYKYLKLLLKTSDDKTVVVYALHSPFLVPVALLSHRCEKACVIVPDLPEYMSSNNSFFYRFFKSIDRLVIDRCLQSFNYIVLLSDFMKERINCKDKNVEIVEGLYQDDVKIEDNTIIKSRNTILYSGIISSRYGVFDLIEAFSTIEGADYSLWLCGNCDEMGMLNDYLKKDSRIIYWGRLEKEVIRKMQREATLLVNPRHSNEEYTKFSFPSKTMEYLASGTPTVMCKLPAIPKEYDEFLFYFNDETIEGFAKKIKEICSMDPCFLKEKGKEASEFILKYKNEVVQAGKIIDLLSK